MNHKAIVVKQMSEEAAKMRQRLAELEAGIRVLGGNVGVSSSQVRRSRSAKAKGPAKPRAPRKSAVDESLHPALAAQLVAIKANESLTPIQKAQASRKARVDWAKAHPATPAAEGASLSEAASAS